MDGLVAFHLLVLGFWGGMVLVEIVFEVGAMRGLLDAKQMARLHVWTDRFLELPLLAMVVLSGALLWQRLGWTPELWPKVAAGLGAVFANLACYVFVERRGRLDAVVAKDGWPVFYTAAPGIILGVTALVLGGSRAGWW